jgi:hypothetical protein
MPGGLATVALAPVASLEAWEHQYETLEALGRGEHVADEDDTWEPPLATLLYWSEQFRVIHNRESDRRPTITTEAGFIRGCLNWATDHEPRFTAFAQDIHRARTRLEDLVHAGRRTNAASNASTAKSTSSANQKTGSSSPAAKGTTGSAPGPTGSAGTTGAGYATSGCAPRVTAGMGSRTISGRCSGRISSTPNTYPWRNAWNAPVRPEGP